MVVLDNERRRYKSNVASFSRDEQHRRREWLLAIDLISPDDDDYDYDLAECCCSD